MADREAPPLLAPEPVALRVAVVAASPLVRAGVRAALQRAGFEVTAAAATQAELTFAASQETAIDVVVLDVGGLDMRAHDGHEGWPPAVLLVGDNDEALVAQWLAEGATLLPRHAPAAQIAAAAQAAAAGLVAASRELMTQSLRVTQLSAPGRAGEPHEPLTARETEVLAQLAQGLGNKAIAEALHISTHTAKFHVAQIIAKLDASSRAHAVAKALRAGLLEGG
jgi:DNA-binding NarL/FixJ family response regulator